MLRTILVLLTILLIASCNQRQQSLPSERDPFAILRQAYLSRNAELAASAYTADAVLRYDYGGPPEIYQGKAEIRQSFADFFARLDPEVILDLNFKLEVTETTPEGLRQVGIYRLQFGSMEISYGTYDVLREPGAGGRFKTDVSTTSTASAFEALPGEMMLRPTPN